MIIREKDAELVNNVYHLDKIVADTDVTVLIKKPFVVDGSIVVGGDLVTQTGFTAMSHVDIDGNLDVGFSVGTHPSNGRLFAKECLNVFGSVTCAGKLDVADNLNVGGGLFCVELRAGNAEIEGAMRVLGNAIILDQLRTPTTPNVTGDLVVFSLQTHGYLFTRIDGYDVILTDSYIHIGGYLTARPENWFRIAVIQLENIDYDLPFFRTRWGELVMAMHKNLPSVL